MGKKVLVTGACGFIGSHLVEELLNAGYDVKAFVHYNSMGSWGWLDKSDEYIKKNLEIFMGDIRDPNGVMSAIEDCKIVFHLAALIGIPYSYHSPDTYVDTNVKGTLNVLQAAKVNNIEKMVHTSTSEVYGTAKTVPITENHSIEGQSPYSATKIAADHLAISFYRSFGTPVAINRPFNTYGPRQSNRAVIPTIITQILSQKKEISLGSLSPTRDFNFVSDTVSGYISQLNTNAGIGEIINIGSGFEISVGDTVNLISEILGKEIKVAEIKERVRPDKSEVERLFSSNQKANDLLSWTPKYAGIEGFKMGLKKTIDWFSEPENLSYYKSDRYGI